MMASRMSCWLESHQSSAPSSKPASTSECLLACGHVSLHARRLAGWLAGLPACCHAIKPSCLQVGMTDGWSANCLARCNRPEALLRGDVCQQNCIVQGRNGVTQGGRRGVVVDDENRGIRAWRDAGAGVNIPQECATGECLRDLVALQILRMSGQIASARTGGSRTRSAASATTTSSTGCTSASSPSMRSTRTRARLAFYRRCCWVVTSSALDCRATNRGMSMGG